MSVESEFPHEIHLDPSTLLHDAIRGKFRLAEQTLQADQSVDYLQVEKDTHVLTLRQYEDSDLKIELVEMEGSPEGERPYGLTVEEKDCFTMSPSKLIKRKILVLPDIVMEEWHQERAVHWRSLGAGAKQDLFQLIDRAYFPGTSE